MYVNELLTGQFVVMNLCYENKQMGLLRGYVNDCNKHYDFKSTMENKTWYQSFVNKYIRVIDTRFL